MSIKIHNSSLTTHNSSLTAHNSSLTAHNSSHTTHNSSHTTHNSSLTTHNPSLTAHNSSLTTHNSLVPKLRFPEFREAGEWGVHPLKLTCQMQAGKFVTASEIKDKYEDGLYPCFGGNGLRGFTKSFTHTGKYSLIGRQGALCGNINIATGRFHATEHAIVVTPRNKVDSNWLYYQLVFLNLNQHATGQAQPGLSVDNLEKINIKIPTQVIEQQKIADCLSSLDELITAQTQKLDTLKIHKKGLMQQIFPAEGETVPTLRFPEFREGEEWEEKALGTVAIFSKGKGISKAEISQNGVQPCIRYGELYTYYKETISSVISYTNMSSADLVLSQANDVILPASGETQIDIATASCIMSDGIALGGDLNIIRSEMNGVFLAYYLNNAKKKAIAELAQGISVVHLYASQLKMLNINIPKIDEQQKIADCLSSLDELITAQTQKIATLKTHKQGLMQQLFPSSAAAMESPVNSFQTQDQRRYGHANPSAANSADYP